MNEAPRVVDQPEPGYFQMRLVRGGPWVAAQIIHQDGLWSATVDGGAPSAPAPDPVDAAGVLHIWHTAQRIERCEYELRLATRAWALAHNPAHPAARPSEPISLADLPPVF